MQSDPSVVHRAEVVRCRPHHIAVVPDERAPEGFLRDCPFLNGYGSWTRDMTIDTVDACQLRIERS